MRGHLGVSYQNTLVQKKTWQKLFTISTQTINLSLLCFKSLFPDILENMPTSENIFPIDLKLCAVFYLPKGIVSVSIEINDNVDESSEYYYTIRRKLY